MKRALYSWARYPDFPQVGHVCNWTSELPRQIGYITGAFGTTLPFGNGRSYGDSCLAETDQVLYMRSLDRFIKVDWLRGIVLAEAGVSLAEILSLSVPNGWFLSVTPGTQFATLGGAIANDVHGKNHHVRGTFGNHVTRFALLREGEEVICSPAENVDLFCASIGGLGLTGVILWAEIQLIPIRSNAIESSAIRFDNLKDFFVLSAELDYQHEYSVAWIDCLAKGAQLGRGVFIVGDHARYGSFEKKSPVKLQLSLTPPISLVNSLSIKVFNEMYWRSKPSKSKRFRSSYEPFFYPLDRILNWNRIYGRKGFQQYQCVIPESAAELAMVELLKVIANAQQGSFLVVLKRCGNISSPGLLSFPLPGISLALDFQQKSNLEPLFLKLDAIVREAGGRLYPAKDAHMSGSDFRHFYPAWEQLEKLRDPILMSRFWKRVTS
ncbi:FAD-binding oxidoreductase [Pseudomonas sp. Hz4]